MRVVYHHDAVVFFGKVAKSRQVCDVTIHGENAVGNKQLLTIPIFRFFEDALAIGGVFVLEDFYGGF